MGRRLSVRKADLQRALDVLAGRGMKPAAVQALPDGSFLFHLNGSALVLDTDADALAREKAAWDEGLA